MKVYAISAVLLLLTSFAVAQMPGPPEDFTITATERQEAIEGSIRQLNAYYVFPDVAKKMEQEVRGRVAQGEYKTITSAKALAEKLTDDFRAVSNDKHLRVSYNPNGIPDRQPGSGPTKAELDAMRENASKVNFGFEKVERLQGNVGYLDIRGFVPAEVAGDTGAAAMNFIANSDALIIDLRNNGGGHPSMIAFLTSYLFDEPTHLNDIWDRTKNETTNYWTSPYVPGTRFGGGKPVYVLTSNKTFSGGEEFAYNLKNLRRATLIGETTGGGAHPVQPFKASARFAIGVPFARAISPVTKTNWEGTGVAPDISMPADQAFDHAYLLALDAVVKNTTEPRRKSVLERLLNEKREKKNG